MSTSCQISPTPLSATPAAGNPLSSRWPFTRLQKLVATPRFVSVDLADSLRVPAQVNPVHALPPLPQADRPARTRLMPWRFI